MARSDRPRQTPGGAPPAPRTADEALMDAALDRLPDHDLAREADRGRSRRPPGETQGPLSGLLAAAGFSPQALDRRTRRAATARDARQTPESSVPPGKADRPAPSSTSTPAVPPPVKVISPDEAMELAFRAVDPGGIWDGKFLGQGFQLGDVLVVEASDEPQDRGSEPPPEDTDSDELAFARAMGGGIQRLESDDRRVVLDVRDWIGARWRDRWEIDALSTDALFEPTLTDAQRRLLSRSRRGTLRTLNLRMQGREQALRAVESFVRQCRMHGVTHVRVITGKGRHSADGPVLKPAVVGWCEGPGRSAVRGWAPETDASGAFGAVVLELRPAAGDPEGRDG